MKFILVLLLCGFSMKNVLADQLIKQAPEHGGWSVVISGPEGGASEFLYSKIHWMLEASNLLKADTLVEDKALVTSHTYEHITVFMKAKDLFDHGGFVYGVRFVLDPKTFGYVEITKKNKPGLFHVFGPAAESIANVLSQFTSWTTYFGRDLLQGTDIECEKVVVLRKDRIFCAIRLANPDGAAGQAEVRMQ